MAGLPKKYIKKYGVSKKAWQEYRKAQGRRKTPKSNSIKRRNKQMARKRTYRRRTSTSAIKPTQILIGGGLYGAIRERLSNFLTPFTSKVPLGSVGDEIALFTIGYYVNKKMRNPTIKSASMAAMAVEAARMGEAFADGSAFGNSSNGAGMSSFATLA